ncbi:MAG TPA: hypothetical protein VEQ85_03085, partial [Lacipirellulaceae bacterium]|nr:hypothetical protein [Lacipirellulaceae bacterium]
MLIHAQSGAAVGHALEQGVLMVRRQLDGHVAGVHALDQQVNDLVARRGGALLELARHYLPNLDAETIEATFAEVRGDLAQVLARKQRREREVQDQVAGAQRESEHQEAELARITDELNAKVAEREKLQALVAERLQGSDEFTRLSEQALVAEQELERNEDRVAEMQAEAKKKLPSYERSRLFKYLYDARYGTPEYQGAGLTRRLDGWVAKMIDYSAARQGYDFLRVTPELMAQEVERRRDQFNDLMQQVEAIEDRVSDELGLTDVMRTGQELGAQRDRAVAAVSASQDALLERQQELIALSGSQNEFYEQALSRMQSFLGSVSPSRLAKESRSTPQREDDAIVAEVTYLSGQLAEADQQGTALARQRQAWDERLAGLQQVLQQFRRAEFDSRRSMFPHSLDAEGAVRGYLEGRMGAADLWSLLQQQQQFAPEWHERSGGHVMTGGADVSQVLL